MTQPANSDSEHANEHGYRDAIAHLTEVLEVLNRPDEGLGVSWGLRRGQAGWFHMLRARNELEHLRGDLIRLEPVEARSDDA